MLFQRKRKLRPFPFALCWVLLLLTVWAMYSVHNGELLLEKVSNKFETLKFTSSSNLELNEFKMKNLLQERNGNVLRNHLNLLS